MSTEKRLIDANALLEEFDKFANPMPNKSGHDFLCGIATAITEIENTTTVDAVEVVRCKDCKHRKEEFCFHENWWKDDGFTAVCENDFCSYGERRQQ